MDKRTPKNLQDLLRFAISQKHTEGNECIKIDEDKKHFLDCVLQSMSVNVMEEFLNVIRILQYELSTAEEKCNALDLLSDYIDNIDFANSFAKTEGADILIKCVKDNNSLVRSSALKIIAEMSQNNTFCQQYFIKFDIIKLLIEYLNTDDLEVVLSSIYALSALIRNYEPGLMEFKINDGLTRLIKCLSTECSRVFVKACFLITSLSSENSSIKDDCAKLGVIKKIIKKLRIINDFEIEVEMALKAAFVLLDSPYCKPTENEKEYIVDILENIIKINRNLPQCETPDCGSGGH
ncbi:Hsp70-binding protein 1 [Lucilia cuprina]|nr:Hsp70-binding protein 1 [Lucilia cuprina]